MLLVGKYAFLVLLNFINCKLYFAYAMMLSIITSYLLQTDKCALPHIGFFNTEYEPASTDIANKQIVPPSEQIVFNEESILLTPGLIKYIAYKKNIAENDAAIQLDNFCKEWKEKLNKGKKLQFNSFGSLQKKEAGNIIFSKEDNFYYAAVQAERVLHQNAEHDILVGDNATTSGVMNKFYKEEPIVKKRKWYIPAVILFISGLIILFFSFYHHPFNTSSVGNRKHFNVKAAEQTHFEILK